ncbi:MAG TPA: glycogen debranching N-terminal domain-containing protein [Dehalococcoidia bacterium]|nr:glycogen debranching N-terminal domain-containing protein [Dehalococcoidia bacterium]
MGIEIRVGPPVLTINRGRTFMVTDLGGQIDQAEPQGVFVDDTRFLSTYSFYINDRPWELVTSAAVTYFAARLDLVNPDVLTPSERPHEWKSTMAAQTVALTIDRMVEDDCIREHFSISNFSQDRVRFNFELVLRSDFADIFEVKSGNIVRRGAMETRWNDERQEIHTLYRNGDFSRRFRYRVMEHDQPAAYANGRLIFEIQLGAGESWQARGLMLLEHDEHPREHPHLANRTHRRRAHEHSIADLPRDDVMEDWRTACSQVNTPNEHVYRAYDQAVRDMAALRLPERSEHQNSFLPAAGVPWFVTLFGRDSLIVSLQNMMVHAPFAVATLEELARWQAQERDDWRDAQPGKILHELRHGELAHFNLIPHTPYYGTADATILYLIVLHEAWKWTGDLELVKRLLPVAERCLAWIENYGDLDGDGFQEYKTFSDQGYENMAWKDAGDAVIYGDGSQVQQPKALCELQGYAYDAWQRMAEIYDVLGQPERAQRLRDQADGLRSAFDRAFWLEEEGTYAFTLDPEKRPSTAVASNAGQCLWSGIARPARAGRVVERLLKEDMFSGWGIRTLSSENPAYNPYSYQRGSVWPHDNGIIAAGFKRYGYAEEMNRVARAVFDAARCFLSYRLPEVYAGMPRVPDSFPAQYIGANIPQAWAAGSIFHFLQSILGLRADAPNGVLYLDPTLPHWLWDLDLNNLSVGKTRLHLHFERRRDGSSYWEVARQDGAPLAVKQEAWQQADGAETGK